MDGVDKAKVERGALSDMAQRARLDVNFRLLFEQSSDGMLLADLQTRRFLLANPTIQRMLGYTEAELCQLTIADIHPAAELPHVLEQLQKRIRGELTLSSELPVLRKDGSVFFADISGIVIHAPGHDSICGSFRDVTARKQAAEALRRSEQRFEFLVANTPAVIFTHRPNRSFEVTFVNENITSLLGYQPEEFTRDPAFWMKLIHPEDADLVTAELGQALRNHDTHALDYRYRRKDGTYCWIHDELHVLRDTSGRPTEVIGCWIDISPLKRAEAEQAKREAQIQQLQKSESLGRMAAAIAHHYNNQLQVVLGNLELAMDGLPRETQTREHLSAAMQASHRAAEVSKQMLAYLGQSSGERKPLDLAELCRQNIPLLQSTMPVVLKTDFAIPGPVIMANANQLQQVLINLVTNAWEAVGPNRGAIRLSVKTVSAHEVTAVCRRPVDWQPHAGAYACLEVADGGNGIASEDLEKIFDPFFSRKFMGRGLGLSVVLGIARAHNGGIDVESEPGDGSTFRVYFPVVAQPATALPPAGLSPATSPFDGGGTVLVVEDVDSARALAAHVIKSFGFTVLTAQDGVVALEMFRQHQAEIRCVLCDLSMPRMNGWQTIEALRQLAPGLPVILASGYDEASVMSEQHPEQPQVFLGKPYDRRKLRAALEQALAVKQEAGPLD